MTAFNDLPTLPADDPAVQGGTVDEMARRYVAKIWTLQNGFRPFTFPPPIPDSGGEWGIQSNFAGGSRFITQSTPGGNPYFWWPLPGLSAGFRLHSALIRLRGPSVHVTLGGEAPALKLFRMNTATQAVTEIGTEGVDDTNVGGYTAPHVLSIGGLGSSGPLIDDGSVYYFRVQGEGENSGVAGVEALGAHVVLIDPNYDA